jgi:hypothetical protein
MDTNSPKRRGSGKMEYLIAGGLVLLWVIVQGWLLPRMGVKS